LLWAPKCIVCLGAVVAKFGSKMARWFRRETKKIEHVDKNYFVKKNK
jgi:hypothetical protein